MLIQGKPRKGRWVSVLFAKFPKSTKTVQTVLTGPSGRFTTPLPVNRGAAGARLRLPASIAKGTWSIAAVSLAGLRRVGEGDYSGVAHVRGGTIKVR